MIRIKPPFYDHVFVNIAPPLNSNNNDNNNNDNDNNNKAWNQLHSIKTSELIPLIN